MMKVYCAMFMGQFGAVFSQGVFHLARRARELGAEADVYSYTDSGTAHAAILRASQKGYSIAGVGYSLGVSTITELQRRCRFDLVFCVAGSTLGLNYPIDRENTKRSVLWKGHDVLSAADNLNFNKVYVTSYWHLFAMFDPVVLASFQDEISRLQPRMS